MGKVEKRVKVPSLSVDQEFFVELINLINKINVGKNMSFKISLYLKDETLTYDSLEDFLESGINSEEIVSFSIKADPLKSSENKKTLRFYLRVHDEENSYYNILSYDESQVPHFERQLKRLINKSKNWYSPFTEYLEIFFVGLSFSPSILLNKVLLYFSLSPNISKTIAVISFFVFINFFKKLRKNYLPFVKIKIKESNSRIFWKGALGAISLGLLINLIYEGVKLLV